MAVAVGIAVGDFNVYHMTPMYNKTNSAEVKVI